MPGGGEIFLGVKSQFWPNSKSTHATRLVAKDSEDVISYLSVIHFDALSQWFPIRGARSPWGCEKRLLGVQENLPILPLVKGIVDSL